jgi:hypothetical protein
MNRTMYLLFFIGTGVLFSYLPHTIPDGPDYVRNIVVLVICGTAFFAFAGITRALNAGKPWWLGILGAIPVVSLFIFIYLVIVPPQKQPTVASKSK